MAPILFKTTNTVDGTKFDSYTPDLEPESTTSTPDNRDDDKLDNQPREIVWRNVLIFVYLHIGALLGLYDAIFTAKMPTLLFTTLFIYLGGLGITAGAHRLWAHRSYKAKLPFRIFLGLCQTIACQNHIYEWARDHRVHHKFSETNADPHNAKRGLFFSHMGWLMVKKHPDVREKGKTLDFTDLANDPVVAFQKRYYIWLVLVLFLMIPTVLPYLLWDESLWTSYFLCVLFRYAFTLHGTWTVNSLAHIYGTRPYDKFINPSENMFVSVFAIGEGFHNYHHTFPMDYSTSEFGWRLNPTTMVLDLMALTGQVYDRKKIPIDAVRKRIARTGDATCLK